LPLCDNGARDATGVIDANRISRRAGLSAMRLAQPSEGWLLQGISIIPVKKASAWLNSRFRPARVAPELLPDDNFRAHLDPVIKVGNILIGHADAPGRHGSPNCIRLVRSMDAV
jgi:hypothetical protein